MAKKSAVNRNERVKKLVAQYAEKRNALKAIVRKAASRSLSKKTAIVRS